MLFHQNTCKTGKNAVEMSYAFHNIARFKHITDVNLFKKFIRSMSFKTGKRMLHKSILFHAAYFLLAVMVEEDESSRLRMAN